MCIRDSFCSEDLGGFYLDILKDRLYTNAKDSLTRKSAQTVLQTITRSMLQWMAPFLSFTAEEAWQIFAHRTADQTTIFTSEYQAIQTSDTGDALIQKWTEIRRIRQDVTKAIELKRENGELGSSLQAEIVIQAPSFEASLLKTIQDDLKFVMITSSAQVEEIDGVPLQVFVRTSSHAKCIRCWHYAPTVGSNPQHPELCQRCEMNLFADGEIRQYA